MKISIGSVDVTGLVPSVTTTGTKKECARTLKTSVVQSPTDPNLPVITIANGMPLVFEADGQYFAGTIYEISKSTDSSRIDITAKDAGLFLANNQVTYKAKDMAAEAVAAELCVKNGIPIGGLAPTGFVFSRNFVAQTLYDAIMTGYTLAAAENGKEYYLYFSGSALYIAERGADIAAVISEGDNLISASYSESILSTVSAVEIYSPDGELQDTVQGSSQYGTFIKQISSSDMDDARAKAQEMINDSKATRKGTVQNLGNPACVTGAAVLIRESFTGLYGRFFIDGDTHTWKNGIYTNKLTLAWENTMNEKEAGQLLADKEA